MSHYEINYADLKMDRHEKDAKAIEDIKDWLGRDSAGAERFSILVEEANRVCQMDAKDMAKGVQGLNFLFGFVGITGRPFHAFCRRYCLTAYKEWCATPIMGNTVQPDEQGFWATE